MKLDFEKIELKKIRPEDRRFLMSTYQNKVLLMLPLSIAISALYLPIFYYFATNSPNINSYFAACVFVVAAGVLTIYFILHSDIFVSPFNFDLDEYKKIYEFHFNYLNKNDRRMKKVK